MWKTDDKLLEIIHTGPSIPDRLKAKGYNHIGDIDVVGKIIYAPLEQPRYSKGRQVTARFDRDSLRYIDAVTVPQHENSFVTVDPTTMTAYSMDHFDGDELTRYDVAHDWKPLPPLKMSRVLHHTQGADVYGDAIWISTDDAQQGIYRVDRQTGAVTLVARMRHPGGEGEGIDAWPGPWASCTCSASTRSSCRCGSSTSAREAARRRSGGPVGARPSHRPWRAGGRSRMKTARALVLEAPRSLAVRDFPFPEIGDDDALLRVEACGLCGTDHEEYTGQLFPGYAFVPGHESVGVVEAVGADAARRWNVRPASASP